MIGANPLRQFPQRNDTMYLDTIQAKDIPAGHIYITKDEDLSLKTMDIEKAQPFYRYNTLQKMDKPPPEAGGFLIFVINIILLVRRLHVVVLLLNMMCYV